MLEVLDFSPFESKNMSFLLIKKEMFVSKAKDPTGA